MRLGGRLAAAIEVLDDIERRRRPAADALKDWGLSHRFAGAGDRAAIGNVVYDALRRRRSAHWLFDADTPRAQAFGALSLEWGLSNERIDAELAGDRFAPASLSGEERRTVASRRLEDAPPGVRSDCPGWCVPLAERAFGEHWVDEVAALAMRPPLDLRVNSLKADRDRVLAALGAAAGAAATRIAPLGLRVPPVTGGGRHPNVQVEPAFRKGWFEVQDEGSQIVADLALRGGAAQVLDFCCGAGGKTLALSAALANHGQIFAHDADKSRLAPIFDRLKRAGCRNVQIAAPDGLRPLESAMDLVLVDAPCTGSGTWRRRPDAKWRLTARQLEMRVAEQSTILGQASRYVRPGGHLVYITCSVFAEENGDRVATFLAANAGFRSIDHRSLWQERHPGHARAAEFDAAGGIVLTPLRTGTDGFFCAVLRKAD